MSKHQNKKENAMPRQDNNTPPSTLQPAFGDQPLLTQRSAIVFLVALVIAILLGTLTYLQTHNTAAAATAAIIGFGGTLALTNKIIH